MADITAGNKPYKKNPTFAATTDKVATILSGETDSDAVDLEGHRLVSLAMPAAFDGTALSVLVQRPSDGEWLVLYDDSGAQVSISVGTNRVVGVDIAAGVLASVRFVKFRSNAVSETADRDIELILKG